MRSLASLPQPGFSCVIAHSCQEMLSTTDNGMSQEVLSSGGGGALGKGW